MRRHMRPSASSGGRPKRNDSSGFRTASGQPFRLPHWLCAIAPAGPGKDGTSIERSTTPWTGAKRICANGEKRPIVTHEVAAYRTMHRIATTSRARYGDSHPSRRGSVSFTRSGALRVERGDRRHVDDVLDVEAGLEHVHRPAHARKDGPHRLGATQRGEELVGEVARLEVREDEHVRAALEGRERERLLAELGIERGLRLHL